VFKNKALLVVTVIILSLAALALACAPAAAPKPAAPAAPAAPVTPPTPPPTPPATPATPAAPAAPAGIKTSFESATYTNDANGYSFQYPKSWVKGDVSGDQIFVVLASTAQGADSVATKVWPEAADFGKAMKDSYDNNPQLKGIGVVTKIESSKATTLADGKTVAYEAVLSAKIMGMYDLYAYGLGTNKGGKTIEVDGWTLGGDAKQTLIREIVKTLVLK
jgi:hypothetical protein